MSQSPTTVAKRSETRNLKRVRHRSVNPLALQDSLSPDERDHEARGPLSPSQIPSQRKKARPSVGNVCVDLQGVSPSAISRAASEIHSLLTQSGLEGDFLSPSPSQANEGEPPSSGFGSAGQPAFAPSQLSARRVCSPGPTYVPRASPLFLYAGPRMAPVIPCTRSEFESRLRRRGIPNSGPDSVPLQAEPVGESALPHQGSVRRRLSGDSTPMAPGPVEPPAALTDAALCMLRLHDKAEQRNCRSCFPFPSNADAEFFAFAQEHSLSENVQTQLLHLIHKWEPEPQGTSKFLSARLQLHFQGNTLSGFPASAYKFGTSNFPVSTNARELRGYLDRLPVLGLSRCLEFGEFTGSPDADSELLKPIGQVIRFLYRPLLEASLLEFQNPLYARRDFALGYVSTDSTGSSASTSGASVVLGVPNPDPQFVRPAPLSEFYTAEWMKETDEWVSSLPPPRAGLQPGCYGPCLPRRVVAIILFSDAAHPQKIGKFSMYPIVMSLGNVSLSQRNSSYSKRCIGYLPVLVRESGENVEDFKVRREQIFAICFRRLFAGLIEAGKQGVLWRDPWQRPCVAHPLLGMYIADRKESFFLRDFSKTYGQKLSEMPCPTCTVGKDDFGSMTAGISAEPRAIDDLEALFSFCRAQMNLTQSSRLVSKAALESRLRNKGLNVCVDVFAGRPRVLVRELEFKTLEDWKNPSITGGMPDSFSQHALASDYQPPFEVPNETDLGICIAETFFPLPGPSYNPFSSLFPDELMHLIDIGVFIDHLMPFVIGHLRAKDARRNDVAIGVVNSRAAALPRFPGLTNFGQSGPKKQTSGFCDLTFVTAQRARDMMRIVLMCVSGVCTDKQADDEICCALRAFLDWYRLACLTTHTDSSLKELDAAALCFREALEPLAEFSKSDFKFPKLHGVGHVSRWIRRCGAEQNFNANTYEGLLHTLVHDVYFKTNRRGDFLDSQVRATLPIMPVMHPSRPECSV